MADPCSLLPSIMQATSFYRKIVRLHLVSDLNLILCHEDFLPFFSSDSLNAENYNLIWFSSSKVINISSTVGLFKIYFSNYYVHIILDKWIIRSNLNNNALYAWKRQIHDKIKYTLEALGQYVKISKSNQWFVKTLTL